MKIEYVKEGSAFDKKMKTTNIDYQTIQRFHQTFATHIKGKKMVHKAEDPYKIYLDVSHKVKLLTLVSSYIDFDKMGISYIKGTIEQKDPFGFTTGDVVNFMTKYMNREVAITGYTMIDRKTLYIHYDT